MSTNTGRFWVQPSQSISSQNQANLFQASSEFNSNVNNVATTSTTKTDATSKSKVLVVVGTVLAAIVLVGLMVTAIIVPIEVNLNNPITTTTTTTMSTVTTTSITTVTTSTATTTTRTSTTTSTGTTTTSTSTTTLSPYICSNMTLLPGYDLPGSDITNNILGNYTLCCAWCLTYSGCVGFTWGLPTSSTYVNYCFLKNGIPGANAGPFVSAHF